LESKKDIKMTARNDITGDAIQTKGSTDAYRDGWDRIFGKKDEEPVFHLRSYGDVSAEDLRSYAEKHAPANNGYQYTPEQVEEMCKPWTSDVESSD